MLGNGQALPPSILSRLSGLEARFPTLDEVLPQDYTVATLPPATEHARKRAWVTDLHDTQPDLVVSTGGFWRPVRPLAVRTVANANADMMLRPLMNSPTQLLRGTLSAARALTLSKDYAYPGARFRIKREATGLFGISVVGLVSALTMGASSWADFEFDGTAWVQTASGGLL